MQLLHQRKKCFLPTPFEGERTKNPNDAKDQNNEQCFTPLGAVSSPLKRIAVQKGVSNYLAVGQNLEVFWDDYLLVFFKRLKLGVHWPL